MKDHQIAKLVNRVRDNLRKHIPESQKWGCLRQVIVEAVVSSLEEQGLREDKGQRP